MTILDRLQQAWQSQCQKPLDIHPDQLLQRARFERRGIFISEMVVILILLSCGIWMLWRVRDLHEDWPWLIYSACIAWVVVFILFNQWRRRRHARRYDEPLLAHVEWAIKDIEHRMWQDRCQFWWYTLPLALGCMLPTAISHGMEFYRTGDWEYLFSLLLTVGFFAAFFAVIHWVIMRGVRMGSEPRRRELESLRALRETLLNTEEPHV